MESDLGKNSNLAPSEASTALETSGGIFVAKGMRITVPAGGLKLRFSKEGNIEDSTLSLEVGLDMCPYWLRIACEHLEAAEANNKDVHLALATSDDDLLGLALEKEFSAAMQAGTAAAIALDALYAMVKERIVVPQSDLDAWKKGTPRKKQIHQVLHRAFSIGRESKKVQAEIEQVIDFRDKAVHPSAKLTAPTLHPELQKYTEWRFVTYRFQNVKPVVSTVLSLIAQLALKPKQKYPHLKQYCVGLKRSVYPIVEEWERRYELLYPRTEQDNINSN